jgi:hypothetical protein
MKMGQIARKSLGLGAKHYIDRIIEAQEIIFQESIKPEALKLYAVLPLEQAKQVAKNRLIVAMRKIDPELAGEIEKALERQ